MKAPSIARPDGTTVYPIKDVDGTLRAYHVRIPHPDGSKTFAFRHPDGTMSKNGEIKRDDLPLYASEIVGDVPTVFVCEGEKAADSLINIGIAAVATVTGAGGCPTVEALRPIANGRNFILWPDNDEAGHKHMAKVYVALREAGARGVLVIDYTPHPKDIFFPPKGDAHDFVTAMGDPIDARLMVKELVDGWAVVPAPPKKPTVVIRKPKFKAGSIDMDASVSDALNRYGINAAPNKNVRCPKHDDRAASLHVLPDDRRAVCQAPTCEWAGRGVIAHDIEASA